MPRSVPHGQYGQSGFTLLEMMIVLVIIGLALGLVMTRGRPHSPSLNARLAAAEIAQGLRVARGRAIALNRPVRFVLGDAGHSWRIEGGVPHALGSEVEVSLLTAAGETISSQARRIVFAPDGSSSGGRIELAGAQTRLVIGIDWFTGRVAVAQVR